MKILPVSFSLCVCVPATVCIMLLSSRKELHMTNIEYRIGVETDHMIENYHQ